jgi:hypothetical protein
MSKQHQISKWRLAYYAQLAPWKQRAKRGHERAAQKRAWKKEQRDA